LQETIERMEMANKQAMVYAQELKEEIIERKRVEAALQEERALLAQRVTERTAARASSALAARLKDEFLASMSHELRTPLSAVLGLTEVLRSEIYGSLNPKQHKSLTSVEESGRHLLALINDILDLSKVGAGKLELQIGVVPVAAVCQASLRLVRQTAHKKRIKVSEKIDDSITILQADERRLKQILINLLSNAVKFTPEGGEIGLEVIGETVSQEVHFVVWDTGIGISQEDIDRLFMPFVQLDGSLSRQYSGTGLGLARVERMVKLHDGYISVESEIDRGSRFTVSLPWIEQTKLVERSKPKEVAPSAQLESPELSYAVVEISPPEMAITPAPSTKNTVLLVEDDQGMANFMENYLNIKGYQIIIARDGIEAINTAKTEKPDIILMDIQMPEMDGLEATRHIRAEADPNLAATPIIAITALAMSGDRERCLEAGANAYLSKPLKLQELVEAIEAQLHKNRVGEQDLL
ncbi:MAG: response regulator, partial [Anaerolineae bacterium]|nr:response regulator [Anaerolineae bacterium]